MRLLLGFDNMICLYYFDVSIYLRPYQLTDGRERSVLRELKFEIESIRFMQISTKHIL
jgi:hypothetical protein